MTVRWMGAGALCLGVAACAHRPPPVLVDSAPPPAPIRTTPVSASGSYRMQVEIQSQNAPRQTVRRGRADRATLVLADQTAVAPVTGAPGTQFNAVIALPGYTRAPRGRTGQSAAWWPISGDSVVVQFSQGSHGEIQLRGALQGTALQGEIWYVSVETGSTFQLGTFAATRVR